MKRAIALFLALVMMFILCGCGSMQYGCLDFSEDLTAKDIQKMFSNSKIYKPSDSNSYTGRYSIDYIILDENYYVDWFGVELDNIHFARGNYNQSDCLTVYSSLNAKYLSDSELESKISQLIEGLRGWGKEYLGSIDNAEVLAEYIKEYENGKKDCGIIYKNPFDNDIINIQMFFGSSAN